MKKIISIILIVATLATLATAMFAAGASVSVSGVITSYNPTVSATVTLKQGDAVKYTATVPVATGTGQSTGEFSLKGVAAGTYTLVVTKPGHLSYTLTNFVVERHNIDLTTHENANIANITLIPGDIDGSGIVDLVDVSILTADGTYSQPFDKAKNPEADITGDKIFDLFDLSIITADGHYNCAKTEIEYTPIPVEEYIYERVVIIGVDGAGRFFKQANTPNIDAIFEDGSITHYGTTSTPSISAQSWGSLIHGVTPEYHQLTNSIADSTRFDEDSIFPSFFRVVHEAYPEAKMASFCTWDPINYGIIEENIGVYKDTASNDSQLTDKIINYLDKNDPKILFVQFDNCDGAGHSYGYGSTQHLNQLGITDGYIGRIYDKLDEMGYLEDTLFIVTADHGGTPDGSHGGSSSAEMQIIFAVDGATVVEGGEPERFQIRDTAAVVLHAFGLEQPSTWTAMVPNYVFNDVHGMERPGFKVDYQYDHRDKESTRTPANGSSTYLTNFIDEERIAAYITFDGSVKDEMNKQSVTRGGEIGYTNGFYGEAADMCDGYAELTGYKPGMKSFSVAMWVKTSGVGSDPCLISNKNWRSGSNKGFVLSLRSGDIKFNLGNGSSRMDTEYALPVDYKDGWMHVVFTVDRTKNTVSFCYDFEKFVTVNLTDALKNASFDGISGLVIGQDGTKKYGSLGAVIDEVIIIDDVMTQSDVDALAKYYGIN